MNLSEYIDMMRLEASKCMLRENKKKIHEISQCVGYDTSTSFTRFFKRGAGITPQEYRDQHKDAQMRICENHW